MRQACFILFHFISFHFNFILSHFWTLSIKLRCLIYFSFWFFLSSSASQFLKSTCDSHNFKFLTFHFFFLCVAIHYIIHIYHHHHLLYLSSSSLYSFIIFHIHSFIHSIPSLSGFGSDRIGFGWTSWPLRVLNMAGAHSAFCWRRSLLFVTSG